MSIPPDALDRACPGDVPVVDETGATFVWRGPDPPVLVGDFTNWWDRPIALSPVADDVWAHHLRLPGDAYVEYGYWRSDPPGWATDPLNPRTTPSGLGWDNHWFAMPGWAERAHTRRRRAIPRGTLTRHVVESWLVAGERRAVYLYDPPGAGPAPLLVVLDGQDYLRRGKLAVIVDNLIADGRIAPIAMALVAHGNTARSVEYTCSEATLLFLTGAVIPLAANRLDLVDPTGGAWGILGASLGGLMALFAGLRRPDLFGRVLAQSAPFELEGHELVVFPLARAATSPIRVWMDAGHLEDLVTGDERMAGVLIGRGIEAGFRVQHGGHNYTSWRNSVGAGLEALFFSGTRGNGS